VLRGAFVGGMLAAPLAAVLYLARQAAGLPFVPFDLFDWLARRLPGALVTFGIDAIVAVLGALGAEDLSGAAKTAEQLLALVAFVVMLAVAGGVWYGVLRATGARWGAGAGAAFGVVLGMLALLVSRAVNVTATAGPVAGALWVVLSFAVWGGVLGWAHRRLSAAPGVAPAAEELTAAARPMPGVAPAAAPAEARPPAPPPAAAGTEPEALDRRTFVVRLGGAAAVITVVGAGVGLWLGERRGRQAVAAWGAPWSANHPLPNAGAAVEPVQGTRRELTPVEDHYRIDINTRPPVVREEEWRLRFGGLVERPLVLSLAELRERWAPQHLFITLSCISNPVGGDLIGTTRWTGVPLREVVGAAGVGPAATHLRLRSVDGFHETVALDEVRADGRIMLAYAWDGLPLPPEHGFPLRLYLPDRYGMKQPKWIESIEAIDRWEAGYWVRRGWDREARMKATSVIDVVASDMMVIEPARAGVVPVGGIAHAGARGVSRVEVSVDGGPWQPAQLRQPLSDLTWVLWRFDWEFQPGEHTFAVRCVDGAGTPQVAARSPVRPSGATGLHSEDVAL